jgi:hypothetical protein
MKKLWYLAALPAAALVAACSDPTALELRGGVAVSFATQAPAGPAPAPVLDRTGMLDDTLTSGADTLILASVQVVLREIELKALETADCDTEPEPAGCEEIEVGPVLVDLPLTPGAAQEFALEIPGGTYSRIDFEVHKISGDDPADATFRQAHPEFVDKSIRVLGTFNGQAFTFESDLDVEQELDLAPPLVVGENTSTNVTIRVDVSTWFQAPGGGLVDPATANKGGQNESEVKENIKSSLHAFEDADADGAED